MENRSIQNGWQRRWLALLTNLNVPNGSSQLREQVQGCRVRRLELAPGHITADVVHQERESCTVAIKITELTEAQWSAAFDALGNQTVFSAQLLAGEMSIEIEKVFAQSGAMLTPATPEELQVSCSCCTSDEPFCRPALAAYVAVGEMLDDDPWLLFRLRGRDRHQVLDELNTRRTRAGEEGSGRDAPAEQSLVYRAGGAPTPLEETPRLDEEIDHYWGRSRQQLEFQHHITAPHIELVLLRRLGPPSYGGDGVDVYENLAEVYRHVTDAGMALAYSPEDLDVNGAE